MSGVPACSMTVPYSGHRAYFSKDLYFMNFRIFGFLKSIFHELYFNPCICTNQAWLFTDLFFTNCMRPGPCADDNNDAWIIDYSRIQADWLISCTCIFCYLNVGRKYACHLLFWYKRKLNKHCACWEHNCHPTVT